MGTQKFRNCTRCAKAFVATAAQRVCPSCAKAEEEQFRAVKEYLNRNPGSPLAQVAEATHVRPDVILAFLRQGRLDASHAPADARLVCAMCGAPILSGSVCANCHKRAEAELTRAAGALGHQQGHLGQAKEGPDGRGPTHKRRQS
jgi:hypothetical protein